MSGECEDFHKHTLNCDCVLDTYEQTKNAFFMFLTDSMKEFLPYNAKTPTYFEAVQFVDKWCDEHFKEI